MSPIVAAAVPAVMFFMLIFGLWRFQKSARRGRSAGRREQQGGVSFNAEPDMPVPFGYECQWYAVQTTDTRAVADLLKLADRQRANWRSGIEGANQGYYFVAPPVRGWTLVVNASMPDLSESGPAGPLATLAGLSLAFGEACYFATNRAVGYQAWVKSSNGTIVRGYAHIGDRGETVLDLGALSREERDANLAFAGTDADPTMLPDEADVLRVAALWSVDPSEEPHGGEAGAGLAGMR